MGKRGLRKRYTVCRTELDKVEHIKKLVKYLYPYRKCYITVENGLYTMEYNLTYLEYDFVKDCVESAIYCMSKK